VAQRPNGAASALRADADWISSGQRIFDESDHFGLRTMDPRWITTARSAETLDPARTTILLAVRSSVGMRLYRALACRGRAAESPPIQKESPNE